MEEIVHIKLKEKGLNETDAVNPSEDLPPFAYTRGETRGFLFDEDELREMEDEETDEMSAAERGLVEAIWNDDGVELVSLAKTICEKALAKADPNTDNAKDEETLNSSYAARLLHLACKLDSVECARVLIEGDTGAAVRINEMDGFGRTPLQNAAEMHSAKCIELLLRKNARTDLRSRDGSSCLALEIALSSKRMQVDWSPSDSIEELLTLLRERDFTAIRLLVERTRGVAEIAYANAMVGRVTALAVLLLVAADKFTAPVTVRGEGGFSGKSSRTVYDSVLGEALALGARTKAASSGRRLGGNRLVDGWESTQSCRERRKALLREIELLHAFGAVPRSSSDDEKAVAPLLRACRAGDETVIKLLLKENPDVNETDLDGNSSLHWCLRVGSSSQDPRIVWLLLKHGAGVSHRNKLGLTPGHVAAARGNYQALQILLLHAPECVDLASETKETPLFFAVKNGFIDCAQLLLRFGANSQALNLRRQRPIDMAKSQDMRFILSPTSRGFDEFMLNEEAYEEVKDEAAVTERPNFGHYQPKTGICRYYESQGGCVRGARCYYAHGEGELKGVMGCSLELKQAPFKFVTKLPKDFRRKVFIGGLPPSVDSDHLKEFFAAEFGPVEEAVVIGMQAGDHVQSRGFGFVTFKQEATVAAALETHFVTIFGKKVEIKGAVAKTTIPKESSKTPSLQPQLLQDHDTRNTKSASCAEGQPYSTPKTDGPDEQMPKPDGQLSVQNLPPWLSKFRKWLPVFLKEASKRLGEGEWYPLSSLKGDFRATCGMELDHASLGILKLSDFMRALPGICRMRVVPVGAGPATHMVLLPSLSRPHHELLSPPSRHQQPLLVTDIQVSPEVHHPPLNSDELPNSPSISELSEDASWLTESQPLEKDCIDSMGSDERGANISARDLFDRGFLRPGYTRSSNVEYMIRRSAGHGGTGGWIPPIQLPDFLPGSSDTPFTTYFQKQWDHGLLERGYCIVCQSREGSLALIPCLHKACETCMATRAPRTCVICNAVVRGFEPCVHPGINLCKYPPSGTDYPPLRMGGSPSPPHSLVPTSSSLGARPTAGVSTCQFKFACQGDKATVLCLPCAHRIACRLCVPDLKRVPKTCAACGHAVESIEFVDG